MLEHSAAFRCLVLYHIFVIHEILPYCKLKKKKAKSLERLGTLFLGYEFYANIKGSSRAVWETEL